MTRFQFIVEYRVKFPMDSVFLPNQLSLFEDTQELIPDGPASQKSTTGSFVNNMKLPVHRWYRYSAGFSAEWIGQVLTQRRDAKTDLFVLDPFAGIGTTPLACCAEQIESIGFETHPFVFQITRTKLEAIACDLKSLRKAFDTFFADVMASKPKPMSDPPPLLLKCYTSETLATLSTFRDVYLNKYADDSIESRLIWLTITAILRVSSGAGTAQWQYVLPNKKKAKVVDPKEAFRNKATEIINDIAYAQNNQWRRTASVLQTDARHPNIVDSDFVDLVLTSPPYPNNYDYADATRLEMTFWGEISGWKDLQESVRQHLIRSCSQHVSAEKLTLDPLLRDPLVAPIHDELAEACNELARVRLTKGGRKNYHTMAAAYFLDLAKIFHSLRRLCRIGSELCFVIGDSAPYGVYLDVDNWLGQLAQSAGFADYRFEKIRDRNIKWKNRKHRVPLKEGRLWIQG